MILYTYTPTPYGDMILAIRDQQIAGLAFGKESKIDYILFDLFKHITFKKNPQALKPFVDKILQETVTPEDLYLEGTPFQCCVWKHVLNIPKGQTISYSQLAGQMGCPKAFRAVSNAVAQNKISLLVPCHRVIREDGDIGKYRWGSCLKEKFLRMEKAIN